MSSSKTQSQYIISTNIDCFVIDSSCLHLTCLSFVTNSWNHLKYNYSIVQSASWPDRFYIIIMEVFVAESQNFLLAKCPPAAMSKEKCVCLQASGEIEQLRGLFGFILLLFAMNESWVIRTKLTPVSRVSQAHAPPPLENFWNLDLLEYIFSILEQKLEFLNRTQTSLNFGFFIQRQHMNNFYLFIYLFLPIALNHWLFHYLFYKCKSCYL